MKTVKLYELKKLQTDFPESKILSSKHSEKFIRQFYNDDLEIFESFFILLLNRNNTTLGYAKISQGGISGTMADIKIIAKYCVDSLASAVILCHNHPSGNLKPSEQDIRLTKQIKEGLKLLDVKVLDHIILTTDSFYSLTDEGYM